MKAILFTEYGSPDCLQLRDILIPTPGDDEVLVRVHASSVNSWDLEYQSGTLINRLMFGIFWPKPGRQVPGSDIAGIVEQTGKAVTRFKPGDHVFGDLWDNFGGFAEYACAHESSLEFKPANMTFEQAAAVPQAGVLAFQGLRKAGPVQPGQRVLINGAGGGVGTFAVQIAKLAGAQVTAVDNAHKLAVVHALGADHVIDYAKEDFAHSDEQYDLILDCQASRSMFRIRQSLTPGGTYAVIGGSTARILQAVAFGLVGSLTGGRKYGLVYEGPAKGLSKLKELIEAGKIVSTIDQVYALSETVEAFRMFTAGGHRGKLAISIASHDEDAPMPGNAMGMATSRALGTQE